MADSPNPTPPSGPQYCEDCKHCKPRSFFPFGAFFRLPSSFEYARCLATVRPTQHSWSPQPYLSRGLGKPIVEYSYCQSVRETNRDPAYCPKYEARRADPPEGVKP